MTGDYRGAKLGAKSATLKSELIPYMLVVGEKDRDSGSVAVRDRIDGDLGAMPLTAAIAKLQAEIAEKTVRGLKPMARIAADRGAQNEY